MKDFDAYELRGVVAPGAALALGIVWLFPELGLPGAEADFSVGDLGVFLILAFLAGHLLQGVSNLLERVYWWAWGGRPSDWIRTNRHLLLSPGQLVAATAALKSHGFDVPAQGTTKRAWRSTVAQVHSFLEARQRTRRIDVFNSNYGLFRGLAVALLILGVARFYSVGCRDSIGLALVALSMISASRMHRFSTYYARELFVQFIEATRSTPSLATPSVSS